MSLAAYLAFYGVTFWFAGRTLARELGHGAQEEAPPPVDRAHRDLALTY